MRTRTTLSNLLMHPLSIGLMMLAAFIFAAAPARAGGYITPEGGVGGSPMGNNGELEVVPTIVDKETLSTNTTQDSMGATSTAAGTTRGIVLSQADNTLHLQTVGGQRTFTLNEDTVVKSDGKVAATTNIQKGDIVTASTNRGELLGIEKNTGFFGNVRNILTVGLLSLLIALTATMFFQKFYLDRRDRRIHPQRQYLYQ